MPSVPAKGQTPRLAGSWRAGALSAPVKGRTPRLTGSWRTLIVPYFKSAEDRLSPCFVLSR